jgi:hypothetical protein
MLTETQAADLGYIVKYAESTRDSLKKRGEQPQSLLLMNLDRIVQMAEGLREQLS